MHMYYNGTLGRGGAGGVGRGEGRLPGVRLGERDDDDDASADGVKVDGASTAGGGGGPPVAGDDEDDASADVVGCGEGGAGDDAF